MKGEKVTITNGEYKGRTAVFLHDQYENEKLTSVVELNENEVLELPREFIKF